jgi:hypothetical protein
MVRRRVSDIATSRLMKLPRALTVFFCAAGAALALAVAKAALTSGLDKLPAVKVLVFAASTLGAVAAMLDWALFGRQPTSVPAERISSEAHAPGRNRSRSAGAALPAIAKARTGENASGRSQPEKTAPNEASIPARASVSEAASIVDRARLHPIVFREIFPPSAAGLSFYGGVPVGPATFSWPRAQNKPGDAPLSFVMQWDCAGLAAQDATGLLPRDGVLYLFCDLAWGDPFDFQFIHAPGPIEGMQAVPIPPDLPPIYGDEGVYQVPYCSPQIAKENQAVPRLLPRWPFAPIALSYPVSPRDLAAKTVEDRQPLFWNSEAVAEALLLVQYPDGVPAARRRVELEPAPFGRPFADFPQDHAAVRIVSAKVLHHLRRPAKSLLRDLGEQEREARFKVWREEAARVYVSAAAERPAARVEPSLSDDIWQWIEGLEPVLAPGWRQVLVECANTSLGLGTEAAGTVPANLLAACAERHKLALAYLRDQEIRTLHAPCPNHMFGPPSFVQGHVEEHLEEFVLLLELSSREPVGINLGEGVLQFMIRPADLRERRFDRVKLVASAY